VKTLVIALVGFIVLVPAMNSKAQDPPMMGLFFDERGTVNCLDAEEASSYEPFEMYLVLLDRGISPIYGYFGGVDFTGPILNLNCITNPHFWDPDLHLHMFQSVAYEPYPLSYVNILITYTMMYIPGNYGTDVCFTLTSNWQFPELGGPALLMTPYPEIELQVVPVIQSSIDCTAEIVLGGCVVGGTDRSWDGVKALYR
jgi:hypothetical protein